VSIICLKAVSVSKTYESGLIFKKSKKILQEITLDVEEGKTFGLVGNSGSGKTTLGKILAGLDHSWDGDVLFHGKSILDMNGQEFRSFRKSVQMVFQDPEGSLNPRKSIERSLREILNLIKVPQSKWNDKVLDIMDVVGLSEDLLCRYPSQISGGQNQRVVIARVLLLDPEIIILDEPTSALDISVQAQMLKLLKDLQKQRGIGYLLISHDIEVVKFMSDRVGVIDQGQLAFSGTIDEFENIY